MSAKVRRHSGRRLFWTGIAVGLVVPIIGIAVGSSGADNSGNGYMFLTVGGCSQEVH